MPDLAVLLMAYGSPSRPEDIEPYLADIRGGATPSPEAVEDLRRRYDAIGGRSPLPEITRSQAAELQGALSREGIPARVFVGMKHWHPYVRDIVKGILDEGFGRILGIVLAPHYARMSIGAYEDAIHEGLRASGRSAEVTMVRQWHLHPGFVRTWADSLQAIRQARPEFAADDARVLFSAHSLPKKIVEEGDPYPGQLQESCKAIASALGTDRWVFAWQSAGSRSTWLGPSVEDRLKELSAEGVRAVLSAPIGFTSDHLEILYDLDIGARDRATQLGMRWARTPLPNASPALTETLTSLVHMEAAG